MTRPDATTVRTVEAACRALAAAPDRQPSLQSLAAQAGWSPSQFSRRFRQVTGITPRDFASAQKMQAFREALDAGASVTEALHAAGFGSSSRLYAQTDRQLGMTPSAFADGGRGETLHYTTTETALGWVVMAATARGICCVQFADSAEAADASLMERFPHATLQRSPDSPALGAWLDALKAYLAQPDALPELPLDLRGTAFQLKVWRYLQTIPTGATRSYTEVAQAIGRPKAVRAVGTACGNNRIAVLVPCHRVLRGDGQLGGYRWGLPTKQALLEAEARAR